MLVPCCIVYQGYEALDAHAKWNVLDTTVTATPLTMKVGHWAHPALCRFVQIVWGVCVLLVSDDG